MTMRRLFMLTFVGLSAAFGGAAAVNFGPRLMPQAFADTPGVRPAGSSLELSALTDRFEMVAQKWGPAVVSVEAVKHNGDSKDGKLRSVEDAGSGVMIAAESCRSAWVVTNNHVVTGAKPEQISILLHDGRLLRPSQILADPETDVALLRVEGDGLVTAILGDSDRARIGQWVVALGSPFGLSQTLTHGIISARERGSVSLGSTIRIKDFLQTDAAINPGSSGGPLLNLDGEVIGINTAIASQSGSASGVAFAIPINMVKRVARQLQERGAVSRGYLGLVLAQSFEPAEAIRLGLDRSRGAKVDSVYPGTPAEQAGLRVNDIVLSVDGAAIRNDNHLINLISMLPVGQKVKLSVWRERQSVALEATIGDWAQAQSRFRSSSPQ
jgi:S1-C subfamily serine protease